MLRVSLTMDDNENPMKRHDNLDDKDGVPGNIRIVIDPTTLCGIGSCTPRWIQFLASPKVFTAHCVAIFALLISSFTYFGGVLTTVERQFQLSSSEAGIITIINDVVNLSLVLFASYFGHGAHRPRWIAAGTILTGVGLFIFTMPHFATGPLDLSEVLYGNVKYAAGSGECSPESTSSPISTKVHPSSVQPSQNGSTISFYNSSSSDRCDSTSSGLGQIWWIIIGQVILGAGSAPLYPLATTYIDDAVGKRRLVSYMGQYYRVDTRHGNNHFYFKLYIIDMYYLNELGPDASHEVTLSIIYQILVRRVLFQRLKLMEF